MIKLTGKKKQTFFDTETILVCVLGALFAVAGFTWAVMTTGYTL